MIELRLLMTNWYQLEIHGFVRPDIPKTK